MATVTRRRFSLPNSESKIYYKLLKVCGDMRSLGKGRRVHARLAHLGYDRFAFYANLLIEMYGKCGCPEEAERVFSLVYNPSGLTARTMLSAYAWNGCVEQAEQLFDRLKFRRSIHWRTMIKLYSINGFLDRATRVFHAASVKDLRLWNELMAAFARHGQFARAVECLDKMPYRSDKSFAWSMAAFSRVGDVPRTRGVFDRIPDRSAADWNVMISAYARKGHDIASSLKMFRLMDLEGCSPNTVTFLSIFKACDSPDALEFGRLAEVHAREMRLFKDVALTVPLMDMYGKCGSMEDGRRVFLASKSRGIVLWASLIAGHAHNGDHATAFEVFREMNHEGALPSAETFVVHLRSCCSTGSWEAARDCFRSMQDYLVKPTRRHYIHMVKLLIRRKQLQAAEELLLNMPCPAGVRGWMNLLLACNFHQDVKRGIRAAAQVIQLDPTNASVYYLLQGLSQDEAYQERLKRIMLEKPS